MSRSSRLAAVLVTSLALVACGSDSTGPGDDDNGNNDDPTTVTVGDNFFNPANASVTAGATVTWQWDGNNPHTVTFDDDAFSDSDVQTSGSFAQTFNQAGTFTYFCEVHGRAVMSGSVTVQ